MITKQRYLLFCLASFLFSPCLAQTPNDSTTVAQKDSVNWERLLDGVNITAQRQLIKQDIDRIGYDVQADEESKTENVLEMLRKVPMVTVDGEENILVKGNSNYKIYRNGHPPVCLRMPKISSNPCPPRQ